jgi:hypothetical protein
MPKDTITCLLTKERVAKVSPYYLYYIIIAMMCQCDC